MVSDHWSWVSLKFTITLATWMYERHFFRTNENPHSTKWWDSSIIARGKAILAPIPYQKLFPSLYLSVNEASGVSSLLRVRYEPWRIVCTFGLLCIILRAPSSLFTYKKPHWRRSNCKYLGDNYFPVKLGSVVMTSCQSTTTATLPHSAIESGDFATPLATLFRDWSFVPSTITYNPNAWKAWTVLLQNPRSNSTLPRPQETDYFCADSFRDVQCIVC